MQLVKNAMAWLLVEFNYSQHITPCLWAGALAANLLLSLLLVLEYQDVLCSSGPQDTGETSSLYTK